MRTDENDAQSRTRLRDYIPTPNSVLSAESLALGIVVGIEGPETVKQADPVRFRFTFRNRFPFTIELPVESRPWTWAIDEIPDADAAEPDHPRGGNRTFRLGVSERRTVVQRWSGRIRRTQDKAFEPLSSGQHTVSVVLNAEVDDRPADEHEFIVEK